MIGFLEGVLREKRPTRVLLDVSGVGYELLIPLSTYYELPEEGKTIALRVHTHVREDALLLFGFSTPLEREVFELLLRTSGVGPKLAQSILSGGAPSELLVAIRDGDEKKLRAIPGVGGKTAQRIIVDLRDRAAALLDHSSDGGSAPAPAASGKLEYEIEEQALSALTNLGYTRAMAEKVIAASLEELGEEGSLEAVIRAALRRLAR